MVLLRQIRGQNFIRKKVYSYPGYCDPDVRPLSKWRDGHKVGAEARLHRFKECEWEVRSGVA